MKKLLTMLACAAMIIALAAGCSSTPVYDQAKAEALAEKAISGAEITPDEQAEMITQCEAAADIIGKRFDELIKLKNEGDEKKLREAFESCTDSEMMAAAGSFQTLGEYLNQAPLDSVNARRWAEFQPQARDLMTKMFEVFR